MGHVVKIAVAVTSLVLLASALVAVQPAAAVVVAPTPVVQGNKLVDSQTGATFVPHGVNIPGLEYSCVQGWRTLPAAGEFAAIASWKVNTVRLPLNESCWLGLDGAPSGSTVAQYKADVAAWVSAATGAGLAVILDLHWNAPAGYTASGQRAMPDERSTAFWTSIATTYASNKSVLFELFNEPYSRSGFTLTWDCWKNGGCQAPVENDATGTLSGAKYTVTGMQTLVSAVRTAGATQPLLLGGLNYSNDLTGWVANKPTDPLNQLVVAWHNYPGQGCSTSCWNSTVTTVAASVPIVTTEFGNTAETTSTVAGNSGNYLVPFMTWADAHGIGYMPWAWWDVGAAEANGNGSDIYALYSGSFVPKAPSGTKFYNYLASLPAQPPAATAIAEYYAAQGGAAGWLGAASGSLTNSTSNGGGAWQAYANGTVFWSAAGGAHAVSAALLTGYTARQAATGPLGWPTTEATAATAQSVSGQTQGFQLGTLFSSTLGTFAVVSPIRTGYTSAGGLTGGPGWPTADAVTETANGGGSRQAFQAGAIYASDVTGTRLLSTEFATEYGTRGGPAGALGWPTGSGSATLGGETGLAESFQYGTMYRSTAGLFTVPEPIRTAYWTALGQGRPVGWPTSAASCTGSSVCTQEFQGATIVTRPGMAAEVTDKGPLAAAYALLGGAAGPLGPATGPAAAFTFAGETGLAQGFRSGSMYQSTAGTFAVIEPMRSTYWAQLGTVPTLGWPTANQATAGTGASQAFQGGTVYRPASGAPATVSGALLTEYQARGGPTGSLGWPVSAAGPATLGGQAGTGQSFQTGTIYTSPNGTFTIPEPIRTAYWTALGQGKNVGWPTSALTCGLANNECKQVFQNATIFATASGATRIVY